MADIFKTTLFDAIPPFVLALDIGSTATRGSLYDARGLPIAGSKLRIAHSFTTASDGTSTVDPDEITEEVTQIIDYTMQAAKGKRIGGVAIDTFAANVVGVNADGRAATPCFTYADSRCASQVEALRAAFDETEVQQRTGTRFHSSYLAPRFLWLRESEPEVFNTVDRWMALGEYVYHKLLGVSAIGTAGAAWTGLLNRHTGEWDEPLLTHCGVRAQQLGEIRDPDQPLTDIHGRAAARWPELAEASWFPVVPDGLVSNIGAGAPDSRATAASAATSGAMRVIVRGTPVEIPSGLWAYRVSRNRAILGGALNDVGRAITWIEESLKLPEGTTLDEIFTRSPDPHTPVALPYFTGERSTGWASRAQASFTGVTFATRGDALVRAVMEGVSQSYGRVFDQLKEVGAAPSEIRMSGRVMQDHPGWLAMLADVLQLPVLPVVIKRATLHGTALLALDTLAPGVQRADPTIGRRFEPREENAAYYTAHRNRFEEQYSTLVG